MATSKTTFVAVSERKIEMLNAFKEALEIIKEMAEAYDNKVINKRFLDKANGIISNAVPDVTLYFETNWRGERGNRFRLTFANRWVESVNAYLDYNETIVYKVDKDYIDAENGWRLNKDECLKAIDKEISICEDRVSDLNECIARVDEVYETYENLKKYANAQIAKLPKGFRKYITIDNPLC